MNDTDGQTLLLLIIHALEECTDRDLLDLIYKLLLQTE